MESGGVELGARGKHDWSLFNEFRPENRSYIKLPADWKSREKGMGSQLRTDRVSDCENANYPRCWPQNAEEMVTE